MHDIAAVSSRRFFRCLTSTSHVQSPSGSVCLTSPVDALFFDLGGVLYDDTLWQRWLLQLLGHMGLHTNYTSFFRVWDREYGDDVAWGSRSYWPAMKTFLVSAGFSVSQADEVEAAGRAKFRDSELNPRPFPHVLPTLRQLSLQGLYLGVWSSFPLTLEQLHDKLDRLGMTRLFSIACTSRDWARTVPPHERTLDSLTCARVCPERAAYVGRQRVELLAAEGSGMRTIAFNPEPDASAHIDLKQFDHLLGVVYRQSTPQLAAG